MGAFILHLRRFTNMAQRSLTIRLVSSEERAELDELYRRTRNVRLRTRAQMILLALEQGMVASEIASIVRSCEQDGAQLDQAI